MGNIRGMLEAVHSTHAYTDYLLGTKCCPRCQDSKGVSHGPWPGFSRSVGVGEPANKPLPLCLADF